MSENPAKFAEVIVPLAVEGCFSYLIPEELESVIMPGVRVEIEFGKSKRYAGLVRRITERSDWQKIKPVIEVLDAVPVVTDKQMQLWEWMAEYYLCTLGEIMNAALPALFRLTSETMIIRETEDFGTMELPDDEFMILEALDLRQQLTIMDVQAILQRKSVMKLIRSMLDRKLVGMTEILGRQEQKKKIGWIRLHPDLSADDRKFGETLELVQRSKNQTALLLTYLQGNPEKGWRRQSEMLSKSGIQSSVLQALVKKGVFERIELEKYSYPVLPELVQDIPLNDIQEKALSEIKTHWSDKNICLLHGITGSGKTHIYIRLIMEAISEGKQVLYLLPEIALTAQLVIRLRKFFGDQLLEYHSGVSQGNRLAAWKAMMNGHPLIIGARSALFLPFRNLGLVIVDEEHDPSYKQSEPAPRYNARDSAMILAQDHGAHVLLGSATPSLESYFNAVNGRYGLVELNTRYGESRMPDVEVVSLKEEARLNRLSGLFTKKLTDGIALQLNNHKQVIIFRNRRGYSPVLRCSNCNWEALCDHCDIHLTVHKQYHQLKCHICGLRKPIPGQCPQCNQHMVRMVGFGTEMVEEELQKTFQDSVIQRFDLDSARNKSSQAEILEDFHDGKINILVGTQMLTKGLDFDQVVLVGVLQADHLFYYPDFRSQERAFQLLTQVSGRSGRREDPGKVIIQAFNTSHPVLGFVARHDYSGFFRSELEERKRFHYPPFVRMIRLELRHRKEHTAQQAAEHMASLLKKSLSKRILGPSDATLSKIKGFYAKELYVKLERNQSTLTEAKKLIKKTSQELTLHPDWRSLRCIIDVDPY